MRGGAGGDEGGGDGASTNLPIAPGDASDGRVSGLVFIEAELHGCRQNRSKLREKTQLE